MIVTARDLEARAESATQLLHISRRPEMDGKLSAYSFVSVVNARVDNGNLDALPVVAQGMDLGDTRCLVDRVVGRVREVREGRLRLELGDVEQGGSPGLGHLRRLVDGVDVVVVRLDGETGEHVRLEGLQDPCGLALCELLGDGVDVGDLCLVRKLAREEERQ